MEHHGNAHDSVFGTAVRGSLKLKSSDKISKKSKKKKKLHASKAGHSEIISDQHKPKEPDHQNTKKITVTPAEEKFLEIQRKRKMEKLTDLASQSHKDKVQEFNEKLSKLSEHHDIPKVGPG